MPFQPGEVIVGKYKVIRLIGTGGVGFVVAARHVGFDEVVALKFLRPEFATHSEAVSRFTIEARASFKIKSEHVARVLDVDTLEDGTPFIAMELLEGTDLRSLLDRCRMLAIEPAVDYALQTCEALAAAHALHIIHRDIKPENLFLTGPGDETDQIKVLDFGISKVALAGHGRQTNQALTRIAVGTPPYMSPEQVRASSDLDARSDIWSLGCVLYELLSGTAPFDRLSLMQSCAAVLEEDPLPLRDLRPVISQELDDVVMRCVQKDPDARYQDVAELAEALTPFGSGQLATYSERCRVFLSDASGRRSTPNAMAPVGGAPRRSVAEPVRRNSLPPSFTGRPSLPPTRESQYPTRVPRPRYPTGEPRYATGMPPRSKTGIGHDLQARQSTSGRRLPTGVGQSSEGPEVRQGLPVTNPSIPHAFYTNDPALQRRSEPPPGLRERSDGSGRYEALESLDASHIRRSQLPHTPIDAGDLPLTRESLLFDDELMPRRSRRWPWVVAGSAALAFGAAYVLTRNQSPQSSESAHVATAAPIHDGSAPSPRVKPGLLNPGLTMALPAQPMAATAPSPATPPPSAADTRPSAASSSAAASPSDLPSGASPPAKDASKSKPKSSRSAQRSYGADDEIDVGF